MCNLSWAERYGIRVVFGKVPDVSFEMAMNDFLKVGPVLLIENSSMLFV
jgi:hypothetical protein